MKHKAQESLDTLWCKATSDSNYCEAQLYRGVCDCNFEKSNATLQDLINCQLTVEEIDILIHLVKLVSVNKAMGNDTLEECLKYFALKKKLEKQKEMWVSDDETN